jgi:hypothetical protein
MKKVIFLIIAAVLMGCTQAQVKKDEKSTTIYLPPERYNLQFIGLSTAIDDPKNDRRSYYKIILNKIDEGRTTFGLESQGKTYEAMLEPNRHLIMVEKWVLDEKASQYIKLNNIEQPKPNFYYFNTEKDKIIIIEMKEGKNGKSEFTSTYKLKE